MNSNFNNESLSDDLFNDPEESIINDSVLKLVSNKFDEILPDEFIGGKLRNINFASINDIEREYKGVKVTRELLSQSDALNDEDANDSCNNELESSNNGSIEENYDDSGSNSSDVESDASFADDSLSYQSDNASNKLVNHEVIPSVECDEKEKSGTKCDLYSENLSSNLSKEIKKGVSVSNQINVWESLLECRIKLQKALMASNRLPQVHNFSSIFSACSQTDQKRISKTCQKISLFLQLLLSLQKTMIKGFPDFQYSSQCSDSKESDDEVASENESVDSSIVSELSDQLNLEGDLNKENITSDEVRENDLDEPPKKVQKLSDLSKAIDHTHNDFIPSRNKAIQKWNDKTKISTGRIKSSNFSAFEQSTLKQIEQILCDKDRLLKRTRLKRSSYEILGKNKDDEICSEEIDGDPEIFDDDDFYHKILREFIEQKASDVSNVQQMGRQLADLQKLRSKMKRPIDVKATKGRRLRYDNHKKLVNFVAPIPYNSWTDEAEFELFSSLFGEMRHK